MGKQLAAGGIKMADIDFDAPLQPRSALDHDQLSRGGFVEIAASTLRKVPSTAGFVLSIEGPWGSGKSSVLAMIQAMLEREDALHRPVIVHFNPWLIGEKEALLRQFLSSIAKAIKLNDHSKDGRRVAKELKAYSKVFDLIKLIPGAEPWASLAKSLMDSTGDATGAISENKAPDIDGNKQRVEDALIRFDRNVIVFIDDVDRLFPAEVFEMIRIIKAVGGLPRVGYVVAWDSAYVTAALANLNVPQANSYVDKIVQVRMPLPNMSLSARAKLFDSAIDRIDSKATYPYFEGQGKRIGYLYHSGLRDLLEQPRDFARVFNAVRMLEPLLRGEIVFADILGLAALSVKAPSVYELLKSKPQLFVGRLPNDLYSPEDSTKLIENGSVERAAAYVGRNGSVVRKVVHFLFPDVAKADDGFSMGEGSYADGVISDPSRLIIALQLGLTDGDVSIKAAREYLLHAGERKKILAGLSPDICNEFIDMLGQVGSTLQSDRLQDLSETCVSIAKLVDTPIFVQRSLNRKGSFGMSVDDLALEQIKILSKSSERGSPILSIYKKVAVDPAALTCAAEILRVSYLSNQKGYDSEIRLEQNVKDEVIHAFACNVLTAAEQQYLFNINHPGRVLWTLARLDAKVCKEIFCVVQASDDSLDRFALHFLRNSWDSSKGDAYGLPRDQAVTIAFCSLNTLLEHATRRLADSTLGYPIRAAWQSACEGRSLYGVDGTDASR
ncbi:KAP family P-loop NTPase fold protein [Pseudomonas canadensis]|uniref:P-loop NTPase fold protein n=1 Tax=Pseudomonas canadensis TaxID=915099 RepID=A0ABZ1A398_9PSED|nr:P-loop NTPase fold protein [Pseudomonas canadensis]WRI22195.1 P-loop NTPase fold protein [Pseudomonas canadensis]